jgi:imidazolonepropionase-like amidohydrolase
VGTLQTLCSGGDTRTVMSNATRLSAAGVVLLHGTDLGNGGTRPGVDPRELERMSMAGLGRRGALEVAVSGTGVGMPSSRGLIEVGAAGALVALVEDPLAEPSAWCRPLAVVSGGRLLGEPVLTVR